MVDLIEVAQVARIVDLSSPYAWWRMSQMLTTRPLALQRPLHFTCDGGLTSGTIQDPAVATTSETV